MGGVLGHWDLVASLVWAAFGVKLWRALTSARRPLAALSDDEDPRALGCTHRLDGAEPTAL